MLSTILNELEKQSKKHDVLIMIRDGKIKTINDVLELESEGTTLRNILHEIHNKDEEITLNLNQTKETLKKEIEGLKLELTNLKRALKGTTAALDSINAKIESLKTEVLE